MDDHYNLRLYVAGQTPKSPAAIANLKWLSDSYLAGRHAVEIIGDPSKTERVLPGADIATRRAS